MKKQPKIVAIIPARGGSKSIPHKNIVDFCGKPLLAWSILQAKGAALVDEIYVSTDDEAVAMVAKKYGAKIISRPADISGDTATSESALEHAVSCIKEHEAFEIEYVVFLQATSPLRESSDVDNAIRAMKKEKADSLFSGAPIGDFYIWVKQNSALRSINYDYKNRKRRQEYGEQFVENGSIYIFKPEVLAEFHNRLGAKIAISPMEFWKSFEVDNREDLEFCKSLFMLKELDKK